MDSIYNRTEILIGKENLQKLKNKNICICGIGGVGSYTLEALARVGIGNIKIIDKDVVDETNINRQIIATSKNIGLKKVDVAKERIKDINEEINITAVCDYIDKENVSKYITKDLDYVIDAIDSIDSKIAIIKECKKLGINIISSMGMANRLEPTKIKVSDIYKTDTCPLAKVMRKKLKYENINKLKVVYSTENPIKNNEKTLGSISYVPATAGFIIAAEVVKDILNNN